MRIMLVRLAALALVASFVEGCANSGSFMEDASSPNVKPEARKSISSFSQFPNIPMPTGTKIDNDKTLVFGSKPWYGQLALNSSSNTNQLFDFYRDNLPQYGWQEITSVRAPTSILTYATPERVLAIAIQSGTLIGSYVTVTASPRGQAKPELMDSNAPAGAMPTPVQKLN